MDPKQATPRRKTGRPAEGFFHDGSAVYDAPIDVLWEFILTQDEDLHWAAHTVVVRKFWRKDLSPNSFVGGGEFLREGKWRKDKIRSTLYPPICRVNEWLEGEYAGTIMLQQFWPEGKRTRMDTWMRLRSDVLSAKEMKTQWRHVFAKSYKEDMSVFPKFLQQRGKG
jgi:hypothetical protein